MIRLFQCHHHIDRLGASRRDGNDCSADWLFIHAQAGQVAGAFTHHIDLIFDAAEDAHGLEAGPIRRDDRGDRQAVEGGRMPRIYWVMAT